MSKSSSTGPKPPNVSLRNLNKYLNVVEAPKLENRRVWLMLFALTGAVLLMAIGIMRMLPLKERIPYVIQVETNSRGEHTGNVTVNTSGARSFTPEEVHIRYFIGKWAINLLTIDERSRTIRLPETQVLLRGDALRDWNRYITETERPLHKLVENPAFRQRAELISITFLSEKAIMIRAKLTDNQARKERRVQITLNFALLPPATETDIYRNPIGLWITTFGVNDELA